MIEESTTAVFCIATFALGMFVGYFIGTTDDKYDKVEMARANIGAFLLFLLGIGGYLV